MVLQLVFSTTAVILRDSMGKTLGQAVIGAPDWNQALAQLARRAAAQTAGRVDLVLPPEQVATITLPEEPTQLAGRAAVAARVGGTPDEYTVIIRQAANGWRVIATPTQTVEEAIGYARSWGFVPLTVIGPDTATPAVFWQDPTAHRRSEQAQTAEPAQPQPAPATPSLPPQPQSPQPGPESHINSEPAAVVHKVAASTQPTSTRSSWWRKLGPRGAIGLAALALFALGLGRIHMIRAEARAALEARQAAHQARIAEAQRANEVTRAFAERMGHAALRRRQEPTLLESLDALAANLPTQVFAYSIMVEGPLLRIEVADDDVESVLRALQGSTYFTDVMHDKGAQLAQGRALVRATRKSLSGA